MGDVIWLNQGGGNMAGVSVFDVAKVLLSFESMTHKKLQKLCYYAQAWHLALLDEPLFDDRIEAWIHGPVSPDLYHEYKNYGWEKIPKQSNKAKNITGKTSELIEEVYDVYGEFDGDELEDLTHQEEPWLEARKGKGPLDPSNKEINHKTMREYYLSLFEEGQND